MLRLLAASLFSALAEATPWYIAHGGPYKTITHETIRLSDPRGAADIVYPDVAVSSNSNETFPFISFCHGGAAGGPVTYTSYAADMQVLASFGFIVVATQVNMNGDPPLYSQQQRSVIKTCKANPSLHPALAKADFSRVGVTGHSMGGIATRQTLASSDVASLNIKAGWLQHPCNGGDASKINVPSMYTTGSAEPGPFFIGCQQQYAEDDFKKAVGSKPRVLFNVQGSNHLDPMYACPGNTCRELIPGALFLSCHVKGISSDCDLLYGPTGKAVCSHGADRPYPRRYTLKECKVEGVPSNATVIV